jgi:hypothetical protein
MVGAMVAGGAVYAMKGCLSSKSEADERLTKRLDDLCKIARDNVDNPVKGVRKLGHYLGDHTGDMLKDWGDAIATIEKIRDDGKHDDRARLTRRRLSSQLNGCAPEWMRFGDAVEKNPEASAMVERFGIRLNRTFEILFGEDAGRLELRDLPRQLDRAFDKALR